MQVGSQWVWNRRGYRSRLAGSGILLAAAVLVLPARVEAGVVNWTGGGGVDQNWFTAANWDAGVPTSADTARIPAQSGTLSFTSVVSSAGAACNLLDLGAVAKGTLQVTDGGTIVATDLYVGNIKTGMVQQSSGTLVQANRLLLGVKKDSTGYYELAGGALVVSDEYVGYSGAGTFRQTGGTNTVGHYFFVSQDATATGACELTAGQFSSKEEYIGYSGAGGTFRQSGGVHTYQTMQLGGGSSTGLYELSGGLLQSQSSGMWIFNGTFTQTGGTNLTHIYQEIGSTVAPSGTYNLYGGLMSNGLVLAVGRDGGIGTLNMGNAAGSTGIIQGNLVVRRGNTSVGTLRGWGAGIGTGASIKNSGRVMADGYGTDRTLDLSAATLSAKDETLTYTSTNGWFAQNHGAVSLPSISFATASPKCWGDSPTTLTQLVNSVRFAYTGGSGDLTGSLLATDHGDVPLGLRKPVAVWDFSGPTFDTCTLTIRYDDVAATGLSIAPADLKVVQYVGGKWKDITGAVTESTHTITANAKSPLTQIAVAAGIVPRGTVFVIR
ncbi:MAG: hypothetical protein PHR35_18050 [Kiritimatiellae bacterium]|nr:hypothetical protein [Kiritimatiellia bacterium]